jgi:hypothetical protein
MEIRRWADVFGRELTDTCLSFYGPALSTAVQLAGAAAHPIISVLALHYSYPGDLHEQLFISSQQLLILEGLNLTRVFCETAIRTPHPCTKATHASLPTAGRNTASLYPATVKAMVRAGAPQWSHMVARGSAKQCFGLLLCSHLHTSRVRWRFCATGASQLAALMAEALLAASSSLGPCFEWRLAGTVCRHGTRQRGVFVRCSGPYVY